MNTKPHILVVGSINMDLILECDRIPLAGESHTGKSYTYLPGGKGANQAVALARLGADVTLAGKVGADSNGTAMIKSIESAGVRVDYIKKDPLGSTGLAVIMLENMAQNRILVYPASNNTIEKEQIEAAFNRHDNENFPYDAVVTQFEMPEEIVAHTCKKAIAANIPVIVDAGPAQDFPLEDIYGITALSPNETETYAMTGIQIQDERDCLKAARILKKRAGAEIIVLKLGSRGAFLYTGEISRMYPSIPVKAVDPTAAGDAFTAALALEYVKTGDIEKSVSYANAVGALTVTRLGAQSSLPGKDEVAGFISMKL